MSVNFDPKCNSAFLMGLSLGVGTTAVGAIVIQGLRKWFRSSNATPTAPSLTEQQIKLLKIIEIISEKILKNPRHWNFEHCFRLSGSREVGSIALELQGMHISQVESRMRGISFWGAEQNPTCVLKKLVYSTGLTRDEVAARVPAFRLLLSAVVESTSTLIKQRDLDIVFPQREPGIPESLGTSVQSRSLSASYSGHTSLSSSSP